MNFYKQCAAISLAATLFVSCSVENPWGSASGAGTLQLNVEPDSDVEAAVPAVRAITADVVTPPSSQFSVSMVKEGGGYSKTWSSIDEFAKEETFPVGSYLLSAFYGSESSQGTVKASELGYEHAYYYGETPIVIKDGETTEVRLSVALMNAIVVIEYTDAFKNYFSDYHTIVQSAGGEAIDLGNNEAMNYVQPGEMNITISATQQNGKELTLNPGKFTIEGKHMYKLRYNIYNGEIGNAVLAIEFDDSLNTDPITVNLSEELENTRAPQVTTIGFEPGAELASDPSTSFAGEAKFSVVADGGISKALLTITSESYKPSYLTNGEIDLCAATPAQQAAMENDGLRVIGFFNNPDRMGEIDFSGLFENLPAGKCTFSLQVTDKMTRSNEPVSFSMSSIPVEMNAVCDEGAPFLENYVNVIVGYNGPEPIVSTPFTFFVGNEGVACEVASVEATTRTRSAEFPVKYYKYKLNLPSIAEITERDAFDVSVCFNGAKDKAMVVPVNVVYPAHTMTFDPMATQLRWRPTFTDETKREAYMKRLRVFVGGEEKEYSYDADIEAYVITGLAAASTYDVKTTMQVTHTPSQYSSSNSVKMEEALPVPNGDFSKTHKTIDIDPIDSGGRYKYLTKEGINTSSILIYEPDSWASINAKTCYTGSSAKNTWFMVPSTMMTKDGSINPEGNQVTIRSVAYDHNGKLPELDNHGIGVYHKHSRNKPTNFANKSAGELFLGSYSFDGNEHRTDGVEFASRPSLFSFDYQYAPVNSEVGYVYAAIVDNNNQTVSSVESDITSGNNNIKLQFGSYPFGKDGLKLVIKFLSAKGENVTADLPQDIEDVTTTFSVGHKIDTNKYKTLCVGSVLTISNLRFEY